MPKYSLPMAGLLGAIASAGLLAAPAQATTILNGSIANPPGVINGSGNVNGNFTIDLENGIELGLRAGIRFVGNIDPGNSNIYWVATGAGTSPALATWNFYFAINTGAVPLSNFIAALTMSDLTKGTSNTIDPLAIGDNSVTSSSPFAAQNSENLGFAGFLPGFNPNDRHQYQFTLTVSDLAGSLLASDTMFVQTSEPAALALFGVGLLGLVAVSRRRAV